MPRLKTLLCLNVLLLFLFTFHTLSLARQSLDLEKESFAEMHDAGKIEKKVNKIHEKVLTIDTHLDTPLIMEIYPSFFGEEFDLGQRYQNADLQGFVFRQVDFPRMIEGGLDAGFFVAYVSQGSRDEEGNQDAVENVLNLIDLIYEKVEAYPDLATIVYDAKDAHSSEKAGKKAIYIGIENGYAIGSDLSNLEAFYDLGVRYMTLSHSSNNDICDSSTDPQGPEYGGLSLFGEEVVVEMNRLGMMVDISHISDDAVRDVLSIVSAPVIASHSNARALYDHPRNLSDDLLRAVADNGGVIQVNLLYVSSNDSDTGERISTVLDVVDHIDHIVAVAGINHVGIGSDFDGGGIVDGCEDVSKLKAITYELVKRGYNKNEIGKIWSGNFLRVFREVEKAAAK